MNTVVDSLFSRLKNLSIDTKSIVFVFDRGNNSHDNIQNFKGKFHYIGALSRSQLKGLYDINMDMFKDIYVNKKENAIKGYSTIKEIYGETRKIVVTYNEATANNQKKKFEESIPKIKEKLSLIENSKHTILSQLLKMTLRCSKIESLFQ
jgi:transposase